MIHLILCPVPIQFRSIVPRAGALEVPRPRLTIIALDPSALSGPRLAHLDVQEIVRPRREGQLILVFVGVRRRG
jgi:hypothetical protein